MYNTMVSTKELESNTRRSKNVCVGVTNAEPVTKRTQLHKMLSGRELGFILNLRRGVCCILQWWWFPSDPSLTLDHREH